MAVDAAPLIITTTSGEISFDVEIADAESERAAGLMFRTALPANRAMLFDFKQTRAVSMWMKNTPLSLDMLFVDQTGMVVSITEHTAPQSLAVISAPQPVRYVLEINAGQTAANGINIGDSITHPIIKR